MCTDFYINVNLLQVSDGQNVQDVQEPQLEPLPTELTPVNGIVSDMPTIPLTRKVNTTLYFIFKISINIQLILYHH